MHFIALQRSTRKIVVSRDVIFCEADNEVIDESHNEINSVFSPVESDISNSGDDDINESLNVTDDLNITDEVQETAVQPNDESNTTIVFFKCKLFIRRDHDRKCHRKAKRCTTIK